MHRDFLPERCRSNGGEIGGDGLVSTWGYEQEIAKGGAGKLDSSLQYSPEVVKGAFLVVLNLIVGNSFHELLHPYLVEGHALGALDAIDCEGFAVA